MIKAKMYLSIGHRTGPGIPAWLVFAGSHDVAVTQAAMVASVRSYAEAVRRAKEAGYAGGVRAEPDVIADMIAAGVGPDDPEPK